MEDDDGDDPFSVFGDDENDESEEISQEALRARSLVMKVNENMESAAAATAAAVPAAASHKDVKDVSDKTPASKLEGMEELKLSWSDPLYVGPVMLVASLPVGGGRGFVASRDLQAGTLILLEEPLVEWSDEQLGKGLGLMSVKHILQHPQADKILQDFQEFHPQQNVHDDVDQVVDMLTTLRAQLQDEVSNLLVEWAPQHYNNNNDHPMTIDSLLRLLLQLRYNGLESGVYRHVAMLNHHCQPNCVKFRPAKNKTYSEVRTTRFVPAGTSLCISYMPNGTISSHATRRFHLWEQHRFDIGPHPIISEKTMEFVHGKVPSSSRDFVDKESVTYRLESTLSDLRQTHQQQQQDEVVLQALEISVVELYTEACRQLGNSSHCLLIPCLRLHLDVSYLVLQQDNSLPASSRTKLLGRMVSSAQKLIPLQESYWGKDHFDLATTHLDLAQAITELLSQAPKILLEQNSFQHWSYLEAQSRKEFQRIQKLYPEDASQYITSKKQETMKQI